MEAVQIVKGHLYTAEVSGRVVPLRVENIRTRLNLGGTPVTIWDCLNTITGKRITVKSACRFRAACSLGKGSDEAAES